MNNKELGQIDKTTFGIAAIIYAVIFLWMVFFTENATNVISATLNFTLNSFGWVYMISFTIILAFMIYLGLSRYGNIKLGGDDDPPEYSLYSWFAMLFSAGLGVGLVFFGVTEPMMHFVSPPFGDANTVEAARIAMRTTFFHWGFAPWGMYGLVGLCLAYFGYRKKLPMLISSTFTPTLRENGVNGPIGKAIDVFSIIAVITGVSTSVGFASSQINSGLSGLYGLPNNITVTILIIAAMFILYTISAISGIDKGIKYLSITNMTLIYILMGFVLIAGPTVYLFNVFIETIGAYLHDIIWLSFFLDAQGDIAEKMGYNWTGAWTVMYWAWWVAFAPFVGLFVARISKGRTIKEFVWGALLTPTVVCLLWFTITGGTTIHFDLFKGTNLGSIVVADAPGSLFVLFQQLPLSAVFSLIAVLLVITLIVTSADSATFVVSMASSRGNLNPSPKLKVFWGLVLALNASLFLYVGGLGTLQNSSIIGALPFMIVILFMIYNLMKGLNQDEYILKTRENGECKKDTLAG
jgi:glycine betaine transporter